LQNLTHTISSKSGGLFQQMFVMLYDKFEMPQWSILALSVYFYYIIRKLEYAQHNCVDGDARSDIRPTASDLSTFPDQ